MKTRFFRAMDWLMLSFAIVFLSAVWGMALGGCGALTVQPDASVHTEARTIDTTAQNIGKNATDIRLVAADGQAKAPQLYHWPKIQGLAEGILSYVDQLGALTVQLREKDAMLKAEQARHAKEMAAINTKVEKLKEELQTQSRWLWMGGTALGVVLCVGGFIVAYWGFKKIGGSFVIGGVALIVICQTMLRLGYVVTIVGAVSASGLTVFLAVLLGYQAYKHREHLLGDGLAPVLAAG
jgi:hypothetical protein